MFEFKKDVYFFVLGIGAGEAMGKKRVVGGCPPNLLPSSAYVHSDRLSFLVLQISKGITMTCDHLVKSYWS